MTDYRIVSITKDGSNVKIFKLEAVNGSDISFKPGQFVNLHIKTQTSEPPLFRQFSIASSPSRKTLEFCIKILKEGKFTSQIDKMNVGDVLGIIGPFGHFAYDDSNSCAFVAAGTGIAPIISMLRHIVEKKIAGKFTLIYSNKTEKSILYYQELRALAGAYPGINVVFTLTQEVPENWKGETGRIDHAMIERHISDAGSRAWYFCGPVDFVKTIKDFALGKGVHPTKIKMEGWG